MARDLSFNIIALDNASKTFTKLALQVDKLSERLDALDHKDVNVDVKVDTSKANASLVNLSSRWQLIGAAIIAASPVIGA
ncbi:MAG: hypothetical protein ACRDRN_24835, partial [Sciscionella sp.]